MRINVILVNSIYRNCKNNLHMMLIFIRGYAIMLVVNQRGAES